jgi:hypothetical protein
MNCAWCLGNAPDLMDGERASLIVPATTLLASLIAGTTYAVYRAHQLAERWRPRGVSALPVLFVVATSISYVANGGTLTQPAPHGVPSGGPAPPQTAMPLPPPPVATRGVPDYALPRQGLDIGYDFGPPESPHPVPAPASAAAATFPAAPRAVPPRTAPPPPPPPPPPPRRSPIPPLPPLPRPPLPPLPMPRVR